MPEYTQEEIEAAMDVPINQITEHIFLGGIGARDHGIIEEHNIKQVIWLTTFRTAQKYSHLVLPVGVREKVIHLIDDFCFKVRPAIDEALPIIQRSVEAGENVLVHCSAGVSRSASIVIAYMIQSRHISAQEAFDLVQEKRICIQPNKGFWQELVALEADNKF